MCKLADGEMKDLSNQLNVKRPLYGRVLFEDGQPAVLPDTETRIVIGDKRYNWEYSAMIVNDNGYFTVSDEMLPSVTSEEYWLSVDITTALGSSNEIHRIRLSDELLSMDKEKARAIRIERPKIYYGRIFYKNGQPAIPPALPWEHAKVRLRLRNKQGNRKERPVTRNLGSIDDQGYFSVLLTEEQFEKLSTGARTIEIMHPSYENERYSYPIGTFPVELLSRDHKSPEG